MFVKFLMVLFFLSTAEAGNLTAPYDVDNAAVLPKSIRSPRYKSIFLRMEEKFNNSGRVEPLANSLNKQITFQNLVDSQRSESDKALAAGTVLGNDYSLQDSPGSTTGRVNTFIDVKVPVLSYGITANWTAAIVVPVYSIKVSVDSGFIPSEKAQIWVKGIESKNPEKAQKVREQLADPVNVKASAYGYKPVKSGEVTGVGDVKLISKHQLHKSEKDIWAIKAALTLPTGTHPDVDKLIDTPTGDGQTDLGARVLWDRKISTLLALNSFAGYNLQIPDYIERRIPTVSGDPISSDKERVFRDSGDQIEAGVNLTAGVTSAFSVQLGYSYQYMMQTRYQGSRYESERYRWLSELSPAQEVHSGVLGIGYSTIDNFKEGTFILPLSTVFYYGRPFSGRNVATSEVYSAELILFF